MQIERRTVEVEFRFGNGPDVDGTFTGYANVWDVTDTYGTRFRPGAFRAGGLDDGTYPLLWMHRQDLPPVGIVTATEDERGLKVEGRFAATTGGQDARALAQMGAAKELSVGFVRRATQDDDDTAITQAELVEVSLVTARMASTPGAELLAVRSALTASEELEQRRKAALRVLRAL